MTPRNRKAKSEHLRPAAASSQQQYSFTRLDHNRATIEEFDREHMGVAAKE